MINAIIQVVKTAEMVAKGQLCEISTKGRFGGIGKICCEGTIKKRRKKRKQGRTDQGRTGRCRKRRNIRRI